MSFATNVNKNNLPGFAKKADLAKTGERFCISRVREVAREGKTSWYIDILLDENGEQVAKTVTFDKNDQRDKQLSGLKSELEQGEDGEGVRAGVFHGAYLEASPLKKTGGVFYAFRYDPKALCSCNGHVQADSDDEVPF